MSTRASGSQSAKPRKERQTRLQEHLRTVKGSRGISPAANAKARAPPPAAVEESLASGRPRRKAATRVVMQEIGSDSEEDDRSEGSDEAGEEQDADDDHAEEQQSQPRRGRRSVGSVASKQPPSAGPSVAAKSSSTRSSPVKQLPTKTLSNRETSNGSIDVEAMNESEVQQRLRLEKSELMARLAQHGINPQAEVLDHALRSLSDTNEKLTVESFLRTLSSLDTNAISPLRRSIPLAPLALQVSPPSQQKRVTFSTLESPSTPSAAEHSVFNLPSPPQPSYAGAPVSLLPPPSQASLLPSPPALGGLQPSFASQQTQQLPHQQQHYPNSASLRANRLSAFANRSHSAPIVPTLPTLPTPAPLTVQIASSPAHPPTGAKSIVATSVNGMGRVALTRRSFFGQPAAPVATSPQAASSPLLPAFAFAGGSSKGSKAPSIGAKQPTGITTDTARLSKLQSWLDDDDDTDDDGALPSKSSNGDGGAEATLKASASKSDLFSSLGFNGRTLEPAMKMVDVPASDNEEEVEIRASGKSVNLLRRSVKRQLDDENSSAPPTTRSARSKGKEKASMECLCGQVANDGSKQTARCGECSVEFHLACIGVASTRHLPQSWSCERCTGVPSSAVERPSTPPPLFAKRVRIGTSSTPALDQEPTFVTVPFSPAVRRNNDFSDCADMALAPSPTQSPVRPFARVPSAAALAPPSSPVASKVPIPVTPQFGEATIRAPGDYSPDSPLRQRRARVASNNGGSGAFSDFLEAGWGEPSAFDQAVNAHDDFQHHSASSHHGSVLHSQSHSHSQWSDVTATPSRAVSSSFAAATPGTAASNGSALWDSPYGSHARRPSFTLSGGHLRTPSIISHVGNDFLSSLHAHHDTSHQQQQQQQQQIPHSAPPLGQRLVAQANEQDSSTYAFSAFPASSPSYRPTSPLNPRRLPPGAGHHRRTSSSLLGQQRQLGGPFDQFQQYGSNGPSLLHGGGGSGAYGALMRPSASMPGYRSTNSAGGSAGAYGVGFDGVTFDDIAF